MTEKRFRPGHDSQLLGRLVATGEGGLEAAEREAREAIATLGWPSK